MGHVPLFLVGMMGSGKSTVGHRLATAAGVPFVDLDRRVEVLFGQTVAELFGRSEAHFRECERDALRSLVQEPGFGARPSVVATGGGAVLDEGNVRAMQAAGCVVYLRVPPQELARRLEADDTRPLLAGAGDLGARLSEILEARRAAYEASGVAVDAAGTEDEVLRNVRKIWEAA